MLSCMAVVMMSQMFHVGWDPCEGRSKGGTNPRKLHYLGTEHMSFNLFILVINIYILNYLDTICGKTLLVIIFYGIASVVLQTFCKLVFEKNL